MKRDMDLCRRILFEIEASPEATGANTVILHIDGRDQAGVEYHVRLLASGGLIEADRAITSATGQQVYVPRCLTWAGHEFIDAAREDTLWQKGKSLVLEKTGGLSFDVLKAVLIKLCTDAVLGGGS
jgi:hypothetical protein